MARRGAKRYRDFLRVAMTAKSAKVLQEFVVNRTLDSHARKCFEIRSEPCPHDRNLPGSRAVEAGLKIGRKRATLDLACPYSFDEVEAQSAQIKLLETLAARLSDIAGGQKEQVCDALRRIAIEIQLYAQRNPMVVLAEAASSPEPRDRST